MDTSNCSLSEEKRCELLEKQKKTHWYDKIFVKNASRRYMKHSNHTNKTGHQGIKENIKENVAKLRFCKRINRFKKEVSKMKNNIEDMFRSKRQVRTNRKKYQSNQKTSRNLSISYPLSRITLPQITTSTDDSEDASQMLRIRPLKSLVSDISGFPRSINGSFLPSIAPTSPLPKFDTPAYSKEKLDIFATVERFKEKCSVLPRPARLRTEKRLDTVRYRLIHEKGYSVVKAKEELKSISRFVSRVMVIERAERDFMKEKDNMTSWMDFERSMSSNSQKYSSFLKDNEVAKYLTHGLKENDEAESLFRNQPVIEIEHRSKVIPQIINGTLQKTSFNEFEEFRNIKSLEYKLYSSMGVKPAQSGTISSYQLSESQKDIGSIRDCHFDNFSASAFGTESISLDTSSDSSESEEDFFPEFTDSSTLSSYFTALETPPKPQGNIVFISLAGFKSAFYAPSCPFAPVVFGNEYASKLVFRSITHFFSMDLVSKKIFSCPTQFTFREMTDSTGLPIIVDVSSKEDDYPKIKFHLERQIYKTSFNVDHGMLGDVNASQFGVKRYGVNVKTSKSIVTMESENTRAEIIGIGCTFLDHPFFWDTIDQGEIMNMLDELKSMFSSIPESDSKRHEWVLSIENYYGKFTGTTVYCAIENK